MDLNRNKTKKTGFTLIEMLVVMAVVAMIASVSLANYRNGEKRQKLKLGADISVLLFTQAQNYTLSGRHIDTGGVCGNVAEFYTAHFSETVQPNIFAQDKCGTIWPVTSQNLPQGLRMKPGSITIDGVPYADKTELRLSFTPPFGKVRVTANAAGDSMALINYAAFRDATFDYETSDGQYSRTIIISGFTGKIE